MDVVHGLLATNSGLAGLVLRLTVGIVMFPHGAQKALGWYGGHGFSVTMKNFAGMGIPTAFGVLAIAAEFLGPIGLVVGLLTRIAAFGIVCIMIVAIVTTHWRNGFFMNWFGNQKGEGYEYHLLVLGVAIALIILGGGALSLDYALTSPR